MSQVSRVSISLPSEATLQSAVGVVIWLIGVLTLMPGWSAALLAFAPLVLYPLVFEWIDEDSALTRRASLFAFLPAFASYGFDQGWLAATLALPWLLFTVALAVRRIVNGWPQGQLVLMVIHVFLVVGASWLVLARFGERPLDFEHAIVHATAVHFHYAGFILPILALRWAKHANGRGYVLLCFLLIGVPLVAAGITLSALGVRWPEVGAVWFFGAACAWFAIEQMFNRGGPTSRALLAISSISLLVAMSLAFLYATGNYWRFDWLDIPLMLRTHGPIQVFGFAVPGVLAWRWRQSERG